MNVPEAFRGLHITRQPQANTRRRNIVGLTPVALTLLWLIIPQDILFWLLLVVVTALVWIASYGWRGALEALHELIHRLEEL